MKNKAIKFIGYFFTGISFYYIYHILQTHKMQWAALVDKVNLESALILGVVLALFLMVLFATAYFWSYLIKKFSGSVDKVDKSLIKVYAQANIAKYIPGNFMQFVGRNILTDKLGYKQSDVTLATLLEIGYVLIAGVILFVLILVLNLSQVFISPGGYFPKEYNAIVVVALLLLSLLIFFNKTLLKKFTEYNVLFKIKNSIIMGIIFFILVFIVLGFCNYFILKIFIGNLDLIDYYNVLFVFVFSWTVGYLMPGSPGGIGIREAVFILLLANIYDVSIIGLVPIIFRFINILGDVLFFLLGSKFIVNNKNQQ